MSNKEFRTEEVFRGNRIRNPEPMNAEPLNAYQYSYTLVFCGSLFCGSAVQNKHVGSVSAPTGGLAFGLEERFASGELEEQLVQLVKGVKFSFFLFALCP